ncbi:gonadotropin-releasing hormone receptor [Trichonephila clavipes]|nr:gonadotropin-releasing hormone receptor [Trichonephila clavipes]
MQPLRHLHLSKGSINTSKVDVSENITEKGKPLVFTESSANTKDSQSLLLPQNTFKSEVIPYLDHINESLIDPEPITVILEELTFVANESTLELNITSDCENATSCNQTYQHAPEFNRHTLVKGAVLINLGVLAYIGNFATLGSIIRRGMHFSSTVYLLLLHLSVSDLFVTSFCIIGEGIWTLTVQWYVLMSFDRLYAVKFPLRRIKAKMQVHKAIIGAWVLSSMLSAPQEPLPAPGNRSNERRYGEKGRNGERRESDGKSRAVDIQFERKFLRRKWNPAVHFQVDDHVDPGNSLAAVSSENHDLHTEICYHLPSWDMNEQMSYFSSFSDE